MFESGRDLGAVSTSGLVGLIEQNHVELVARECRVLELAAAWADRHYLLGCGRRLLIADALDLRYRLPRLWDRVRTGGVRAWQARKVAEATRALSWEAASNLDHALSDYLGVMPWPRFRKILAAAVLDADPELAAERAERARRSQDVYCFDSEDGLKTIVTKATSGDAVWPAPRRSTATKCPPRLRAAVRYWQVADVSPFGTCVSSTMDLDHTEPYVPMDYGGPPVQTRFDNLGPMALGRSEFSRAVWNATRPQPETVAA